MSPYQEHSTGLGAPQATVSAAAPRPDGPHSPRGPGSGERPASGCGLAWSDPSGATRTRLDVVAGVCVVRIEGALGLAALQPCRAALDAASALHPETVIVDLGNTTAPEPVTLALLAAARRYLRHRGVVMTLTAVPVDLLREFSEAQVAGRYEIQPTTAIAVARVRTVVMARRPGRLPTCVRATATR